jgi:hypothetical protein
MDRNKNRIIDITVGLAIVIGIAVNEYLTTQTNLPKVANWVVTILVSATIHEIMFWILTRMINNFDLLLKLFWGKLYIKGYWSYTYIVGGEVRYGAWCIDQDIDGIKVKGFGITKEGIRRSDVQSLTSLLVRGNDYEVVNMRRDVDNDGSLSDLFYYSKTALHFQQRDTFLNLFNYPLRMDGTTYIYGGTSSGIIHTNLVFVKHKKAKDEHDIEEIVKKMIS